MQGRGWESYQEMMFQLVWQPESDRKHRTSLDAMRQRWLHLAHTARKAGLERSRFWAERILRAAFASKVFRSRRVRLEIHGQVMFGHSEKREERQNSSREPRGGGGHPKCEEEACYEHVGERSWG